MSRYGRPQIQIFTGAAVSLLCALSAMPLPLHAQPKLLPEDILADVSYSIFEERFFADRRVEPVFMHPEIQSLLAALPPWTAVSDNVEPSEVTEAHPTIEIPFAELKRQAKVLVDLQNVYQEQLASESKTESEAQEQGTGQGIVTVPSQKSEMRTEPLPPEGPVPPSLAGLDQTGDLRPEQNESVAQEVGEPQLGRSSPPENMTAAPTIPPVRPSPKDMAPQDAMAASDSVSQPADNQTAETAHKESREQSVAGMPESRGAARSRGTRRIGTGRATWYQHPGRTASGEKFDPDQLTAAHHTLPFGTWLRVVNEQTGRSLSVRINDRIPRTTRLVIIDLSRGSARALGISGIGDVSLHQELEQYEKTTASAQLAAHRSFMKAVGVAISRSLERSQLEEALRASLQQRAVSGIEVTRSAERSQFLESTLKDLLRQRAAQL